LAHVYATYYSNLSSKVVGKAWRTAQTVGEAYDATLDGLDSLLVSEESAVNGHSTDTTSVPLFDLHCKSTNVSIRPTVGSIL